MSVGISTKNSGGLKKIVVAKKGAPVVEEKEENTIVSFLKSDLFSRLLSAVIGIAFVIFIGHILGMGSPSGNVTWAVYMLVILIILIAAKVKAANWSRYLTWCVVGLVFFLFVAILCKLEDRRTDVVKGVNPIQKVYNWTVKTISEPSGTSKKQQVDYKAYKYGEETPIFKLVAGQTTKKWIRPPKESSYVFYSNNGKYEVHYRNGYICLVGDNLPKKMKGDFKIRAKETVKVKVVFNKL